jgi:NAD(P)H-dependent FMN reductase
MKKILLTTFFISMLAGQNILVFSGSTRKDSMNKKLALEAAAELKNLGAKVTYVDLKDFAMPFYDGDLESKGMPKEVKKFRDLMAASDAIVIASPEYNGSLSAILKNAIDWASRSEQGEASRSCFKGKKFALMSASPSPYGGIRSLNHLRDVISQIGGEVVEKQVSVPNAYSAFDNEGHLVDDELRKDVREQAEALLD